MGAVAGVGGSAWARARLKRAVRQRMPAGSADAAVTVTDGIRRLVGGMSDVLEDGRSAMREHEAELRARLVEPERSRGAYPQAIAARSAESDRSPETLDADLGDTRDQALPAGAGSPRRRGGHRSRRRRPPPGRDVTAGGNLERPWTPTGYEAPSPNSSWRAATRPSRRRG